MEDNKRKRAVFEILEGGLKGNPAARAFSWTLIVLILLSITFMLIWDLEGAERWHRIFEVIETITVGVFTLELLFGCWTADIRFPDDAHPVLHYLREPMTIIQMLAILPFYMGVILNNTSLYASIVLDSDAKGVIAVDFNGSIESDGSNPDIIFLKKSV